MTAKLNFSAMSVAYIQHSLEYTIDSFKRLGFKAIEFWAAEPHFYAEDFSNHDEALRYLADLKKKFDENGIKVVMYTSETLAYPFSYSHPNSNVRKRTVEYMKRACLEALALGCRRVFINSGCGLRDLDREESWKNCVESFREICHFAADLGIDIVLEQLQPYESNLVIKLEDCKRMKKEVGFKNLKICLDLVAMEVAGESIDQYFDTFKSDIVHIHLADKNHEILGDGDYHLDKYLKYLESQDFKGYVSLEINDSIYWTNPHESLEKSKIWLEDRGYSV